MKGYRTPEHLSTMFADDGGALVVSPVSTRRVAREMATAICGVDLSDFDADRIAARGEVWILHRCLVADVDNGIGEEPGWWHTDGSGVRLDCVHFGRDVIEELHAEWQRRNAKPEVACVSHRFGAMTTTEVASA